MAEYQFTLSAFADEISMDLNEQMRVLKKIGISHIEMRGVDGKNISEVTCDEAREIKRRLDAEGFAISALGSPFGKIGIQEDFKPHYELFLRGLENAQILGTEYIRMFSFYLPQDQDAVLFREEVLDRLGRMIEAAKQTPITLLHENESHIYGDTIDRCVDLMQEFYQDGSNHFAFTFDPANFIMCDQEPFPKAYEALKQYIRYVHIKDAIRIPTKKVVPSGMGEGRIKALLDQLKQSGYRGFLSIEPHLGSFEGLEKLETAMDISQMEKGGAGLFLLAHQALQDCLNA